MNAPVLRKTILHHLAGYDRFLAHTTYVADAVRRAHGEISTHRVNAALKSAESDGLVTRSCVPNGFYGYRWTLTPAGAEAAKGGEV